MEALESVLNQTLTPAQIIVVDDASEDGSQTLIREYARRYPDLIDCIFHRQNKGVTQTRIDALKAVKSDYVTYVDGDDRFLPTKLEVEAAALRNDSEASIAFSDSYYINPDGGRKGRWAEGKTPPDGQVFSQTYARDFPRRRLFRMELVDYEEWVKVGFHDPSLSLYEDYDMRIRLSKRLRTVYCDQPLSEIRQDNGGLSSRHSAQHLSALEYVYEKNHHLLDDLGPCEKNYVEKTVRPWLAKRALKAAWDQLESSDEGAAAITFFLKALQYDRNVVRVPILNYTSPRELVTRIVSGVLL